MNKQILSIFFAICCFLVIDSKSSAIEVEIDQAYETYNTLQLDFYSSMSASKLYDEILFKLKETDFFVKSETGEHSMVMIEEEIFPMKIWKELRILVDQRKELRMYKFVFLENKQEGVKESYLFWFY